MLLGGVQSLVPRSAAGVPYVGGALGKSRDDLLQWAIDIPATASIPGTDNYGATMSVKFLSFIPAAAVLVSIGMANAKDPVKLTDGQLDKVTAGATNVSSGFSQTTTTTVDSSTTSAAGGAGSSFNTASLTHNTVDGVALAGPVSMAPNSMNGQGILQANQNTGANAVQQNSVALTFGFIPAITTP
jgi:hypothetical protein